MMNHARMKRHTKIVCTLAPASSSAEVVERMLKGGMDIERCNLAHGTFEEHSRLISQVRLLSQGLNMLHQIKQESDSKLFCPP
jgi:pyruvate kinase